MALNPDIAAYLELVGNGRSSGKSLPMHQLTVQQAREQFDQSSALMDPGLDEPLARVETLFVPARDGTPLPARLYSPQGLSASPPLPGVLYLHGGGYVVGSLDSHDALCASLAERAGCVVLSLAYRLAPEWRFPTAAEDAEDAWCWLAAEAARLGIDPQRLAVAGDSVGGSLCAVLSHRLALRGDASQPRLQVLIYPVTDASRTHQSIERYAVGHLLEKDSLEWFYQHYQRSPEDRQDPRFSPLLGVVPADLAPTLLLVAECDPLHDEGIAYAEHLRQGGARVELCVYPGMTHDFLRMGAIVDEADDAKRHDRRRAGGGLGDLSTAIPREKAPSDDLAGLFRRAFALMKREGRWPSPDALPVVGQVGGDGAALAVVAVPDAGAAADVLLVLDVFQVDLEFQAFQAQRGFLEVVGQLAVVQGIGGMVKWLSAVSVPSLPRV